MRFRLATRSTETTWSFRTRLISSMWSYNLTLLLLSLESTTKGTTTRRTTLSTRYSMTAQAKRRYTSELGSISSCNRSLQASTPRSSFTDKRAAARLTRWMGTNMPSPQVTPVFSFHNETHLLQRGESTNSMTASFHGRSVNYSSRSNSNRSKPQEPR